MDTAELLQGALQMEREGQAQYRSLAENAQDEVLRAVLRSLADDEERHARSIQQLYSALQDEESWPEPSAATAPPESVQTTVASIIEGTVGRLRADATAIQAYQTALALEQRAYQYYRTGGEEADSPSLRKWFGMLAGLERLHVESLERLLHFCQQPAAR